MDKTAIEKILEKSPVIAAVKDDDGLARCLAADVQVVFVLYGTVVDIPAIVEKIKVAGKAAIVHIDLIDGLSSREVAADFIAASTLADGVISTKGALVRRARELGLVGIRRFFLLDSMALQNLQKGQNAQDADFIEVLPGVMPKILVRVVSSCPLPVIAGGLIGDKEDVVSALSCGVLAVSTTNAGVWQL